VALSHEVLKIRAFWRGGGGRAADRGYSGATARRGLGGAAFGWPGQSEAHAPMHLSSDWRVLYNYGVSKSLGGLAEFERELIRARTGEGRKRAKANGVKFGRPSVLTVSQRQEALQRLADGNAQADVARTFKVSQATISRLAAVS